MTLNRQEDVAARVTRLSEELRAFRRDLHAHPELSRAEFRTTQAVRGRLEAAGLAPRVLSEGTGLVCDVGPVEEGYLALRADIDALPVSDEKDVPYRSTVADRCHACGHDVHTTIALGAGLVLAELARDGVLTHGVRLVFQPAEEIIPGGALDVLAARILDGVGRILAFHCDPRVPVGHVALRQGPITSACDQVRVSLTGPGGHTARPHLSADLVYALAKLVTDLPAALSRRVDPRAGLSLVWGRVEAGSAANVIPQTGRIEGTVRCLDSAAWHEAPEHVLELVDSIAALYGVKAEVAYERGVPPVVNEADSIALFERAVTEALGPGAVTTTQQSLGGEDFAWYLERMPGALARLGVRAPDDLVTRDLHQGLFDVDEGAIDAGVRTFVTAALLHNAD